MTFKFYIFWINITSNTLNSLNYADNIVNNIKICIVGKP
jgi:hypothetical protein